MHTLHIYLIVSKKTIEVQLNVEALWVHRPQSMDPHCLILGDSLGHVSTSPVIGDPVYPNKWKFTRILIMALGKVPGDTMIREAILDISHMLVNSNSKFSSGTTHVL